MRSLLFVLSFATSFAACAEREKPAPQPASPAPSVSSAPVASVSTAPVPKPLPNLDNFQTPQAKGAFHPSAPGSSP